MLHSPAMQRTLDMIDRETAHAVYDGHKRLARRYLREQPVMMSPRAIHIVSRFARSQKRLAALEEVA